MPTDTDDAERGDEVDRLVAEWARERPDLDLAPLEVLSHITRLAKHLERYRRQAFATNQLEGWGFDVLTALRRSGPPYELTPGALLRRTLVTSGTMTNRVDRLESAGLVSRRTDPGDGRGVLVRLTARGKKRVDACLVDLLAGEAELLGALTTEEQGSAAALLRRLLVPFDGDVSDPPPRR